MCNLVPFLRHLGFWAIARGTRKCLKRINKKTIKTPFENKSTRRLLLDSILNRLQDQGGRLVDIGLCAGRREPANRWWFWKRRSSWLIQCWNDQSCRCMCMVVATGAVVVYQTWTIGRVIVEAAIRWNRPRLDARVRGINGDHATVRRFGPALGTT